MTKRKYPCEYCETEKPLQEKVVFLPIKYKGEWFIFEQVPAKVCQQCHNEYFDGAVIEAIEQQIKRELELVRVESEVVFAGELPSSSALVGRGILPANGHFKMYRVEPHQPNEMPSKESTMIIEPLVFCEDFTYINLEAVRTRDQFPLGVRNIAVVYTFDGVPPDASAEVEWYGNGVLLLTQTFQFPGHKGRHAHIYRNSVGLDNGTYQARIKIDGDVVQSGEFKVGIG